MRILLTGLAFQITWGPLSFAAALYAARNRPDERGIRHLLQASVSIGHLYGVALYYGTCTFAEHMRGTVFCRPEAVYYWGYYVGMNAPWVVVPASEFLLFLLERSEGWEVRHILTLIGSTTVAKCAGTSWRFRSGREGSRGEEREVRWTGRIRRAMCGRCHVRRIRWDIETLARPSKVERADAAIDNVQSMKTPQPWGLSAYAIALPCLVQANSSKPPQLHLAH